MKPITLKPSTASVGKFRKLVKNKKITDFQVLREYWNFQTSKEYINDFDYFVADFKTIDTLMYKHRRTAWHYKEFEWSVVKTL